MTSVRSKSVNGGDSSGTKKPQVDGAQFVGERDDGKLGNESRPSKPMSSIGSRQIIYFIIPREKGAQGWKYIGADFEKQALPTSLR